MNYFITIGTLNDNIPVYRRATKFHSFISAPHRGAALLSSTVPIEILDKSSGARGGRGGGLCQDYWEVRTKIYSVYTVAGALKTVDKFKLPICLGIQRRLHGHNKRIIN